MPWTVGRCRIRFMLPIVGGWGPVTSILPLREAGVLSGRDGYVVIFVNDDATTFGTNLERNY